MARFNFRDITTPGGIGEGISNLTGALVEAPNKRRQLEMQLAEMEARKQGRAFDQGMQQQSLSRQLKADEANQGFRERELGLREQELNQRGVESMGRGIKNFAGMVGEGLGAMMKRNQEQPLIDSQINRNNAMAERARRPASPKAPDQMSPGEYAQLERLAQAEADDAVKRAKGALPLSDPNNLGVPPSVDASVHPTALLQARLRYGVPNKPPWVGGTPPQNPSQENPGAAPGQQPAAGTPVSGMRAHLTALFGGTIPAGAGKALQAAEQGNPDALNALIQKYGQPPGGQAVQPEIGGPPIDSGEDEDTMARELLGGP